MTHLLVPDVGHRVPGPRGVHLHAGRQQLVLVPLGPRHLRGRSKGKHGVETHARRKTGSKDGLVNYDGRGEAGELA